MKNGVLATICVSIFVMIIGYGLYIGTPTKEVDGIITVTIHNKSGTITETYDGRIKYFRTGRIAITIQE